MHTPMFTSKTAEHYTPKDVIERMRWVFDGSIALDPASNAEANATIKAERYYTEADDGLNASWLARSVWLNPPYSVEKRDAHGSVMISTSTGKPIRQRVIGAWVDRWLETIDMPSVTHAALLVPARTDTAWFQPLFGLACCFVSGRLTFGDAASGAPFPTAIFYVGPNLDRFNLVFGDIGVCGRFQSLEN